MAALRYQRHTKTMSREDFDLPYFGEPDSTRAPLKIQDGCSAMCSFCIIPFSRGRERSRKLEDILQEARSLAARGYREIVLTGVNLGRLMQCRRNAERIPSTVGVILFSTGSD